MSWGGTAIHRIGWHSLCCRAMLVTLIILTIRIPTLNGNQVFTECKITKIFAYMQMYFRRLRCGGSNTDSHGSLTRISTDGMCDYLRISTDFWRRRL